MKTEKEINEYNNFVAMSESYKMISHDDFISLLKDSRLSCSTFIETDKLYYHESNKNFLLMRVVKQLQIVNFHIEYGFFVPAKLGEKAEKKNVKKALYMRYFDLKNLLVFGESENVLWIQGIVDLVNERFPEFIEVLEAVIPKVTLL